MLAALTLALATVVPFVLGNITISGPSDKAYWIQFTENNITWTFAQGDPSPISIIITNSEQTELNGAFSIAEYTDTSAQHFTVTNVTLVQGGNYVVNFVNPTNASQVYATSKPFEVKPLGTAPANTIGESDLASTASSSSSGTSTASVENPQGTAPPDNAASRISVASGAGMLLAGAVALLF
ncbi:hypothetical protein EXIGLDRAFT_723773 [Exidia glandulosa HHB12029]|uniref:Yeast cell wall synthesis Kre9/Knh1-like N-terminal domain-containing protein n=1 Tax=Exidia glandulosa HHB12029 TaxID=1314781 RepID=A0A166A0E0_EXIGL|nr:hypothetical protein EXIGLDRAFT_723773 [Exidia glandulosa HHB12029]